MSQLSLEPRIKLTSSLLSVVRRVVAATFSARRNEIHLVDRDAFGKAFDASC